MNNDTIGQTIEKWIVEASSSHNDGWTKLHYTKQLIEIKERLNSLDFLSRGEMIKQYGEENIK